MAAIYVDHVYEVCLYARALSFFVFSFDRRPPSELLIMVSLKRHHRRIAPIGSRYVNVRTSHFSNCRRIVGVVLFH